MKVRMTFGSSFQKVLCWHSMSVFCKRLEDAGLEAPTIGDYSCNTGTCTMRQHLIAHHQDKWIPACLKMGLPLTLVKPKIALRQYCKVHGHASLDPAENVISPFSSEAFIDAIVEFIVADDQDLQDSDIPHWTSRDTPEGLTTILNLQAELVGFYSMPGRHSGEHLAAAFLHMLD
ncbi:hypothetical protein FA15DRAFT_661918 [Coprinopsis marcescibilis]|uniref:Uncharacterized protein n=1 Tax=Coprinopsis marcescibilis TaxID=230819 RepID=A0A5C3K9P0_COPMA|nr:hypothetical protein FA15DRAFT_661918 [Coprinopsis marcescibilis]